jgi:hypothetical protein
MTAGAIAQAPETGADALCLDAWRGPVGISPGSGFEVK